MNEFNLEIIEHENDVSYEIAKVSFPAYEDYKDKALAVADYIGSMTVTADNVKETKQTLAKARKLTDRLDRARIDMKKEILQNYTVFEKQVKEIVGIVADADRELRGKVRELEEAEREAKKKEIYALWEKRLQPYPIITKIMPDAFERWITPKHLNKSTSMKSVETDMTAWIQKTLQEIDVVSAMGDEYLAAYGWQGDLAKAIDAVNSQKNVIEAVSDLRDEEPEEETAVFIISGRANIELTARLLNENGIEFKRK